MLIRVLVMCFLFALMAAPISAASAVVEFDDPAGDVVVNYPPVGTPGPWADGVDILAVTIRVENATLTTTMHVADLRSLDITEAGGRADTMFIVSWRTNGTERDGDWNTRVDFQPSASPPWTYWAEGPCKVHYDDGSCPGNERDIYWNLNGFYDLEANTVTVHLPIEPFGARDASSSITGFRATTDVVWPSYPLYAGDDAFDERQATITLGWAGGAGESGQENVIDGNRTSETSEGAIPGLPWLTLPFIGILAVWLRGRKARRWGHPRPPTR